MKQLIYLTIFFVSSSCFAQGLDFFSAFSIKYGSGDINAKNISNREHQLYGQEILAGIYYSGWIWALGYSFLQWNQKNNINDHTNFSGLQENYSFNLGYSNQYFAIIFGQYFSSTFERSLEDANSKANTYLDPKFSSYSIKLLYNIIYGGFLGIEYNNFEYNKIKNSSTSSISQDETIKMDSLLFILGKNF